MRWLLTTALLGTLLQAPPGAGLHNRMMDIEGVGEVTYGFWVPRDYDESAEVPLILVLHPGGSQVPATACSSSAAWQRPVSRTGAPSSWLPTYPTNAGRTRTARRV